jgi:hypothetical protein
LNFATGADLYSTSTVIGGNDVCGTIGYGDPSRIVTVGMYTYVGCSGGGVRRLQGNNVVTVLTSAECTVVRRLYASSVYNSNIVFATCLNTVVKAEYGVSTNSVSVCANPTSSFKYSSTLVISSCGSAGIYLNSDPISSGLSQCGTIYKLLQTLLHFSFYCDLLC